MNDYVKYWPIVVSLVGILFSIIAQWAVFGIRISNIEGRQDRQDNVILILQGKQTAQEAIAAELKAKLDAISENVNYIRNRIDRATQ